MTHSLVAANQCGSQCPMQTRPLRPTLRCKSWLAARLHSLLLLLLPLHCFGSAFSLSIPSAFITLLLGHVICWTAGCLTAWGNTWQGKVTAAAAAAHLLVSEQKGLFTASKAHMTLTSRQALYCDSSTSILHTSTVMDSACVGPTSANTWSWDAQSCKIKSDSC